MIVATLGFMAKRDDPAADGRRLDEILEVIEAMHAAEEPDPAMGLRERKKRRVRQRISDVATAMFLAYGFDQVTVARIAAACEVSEQTVFNHYPTKESMFLDRSGPTTNAVATAVRDRDNGPLAEAVQKVLTGGRRPDRGGTLDEGRRLHVSRLYCQTATRSPTLAAAQRAELARCADEVATALAHRVDADPTDPEVLMAAHVIAGLPWVRIRSTYHHAQQATSIDALDKAVRGDILRALRIAEPTLTAFDRAHHPADH